LEHEPLQRAGVGGDVVSFKTIELALNYDRYLTRYQFQPLPKPRGLSDEEYLRGYLNAWAELLKQEKQRQLNMRGDRVWPPTLPWKVSGLWDMPVIIWFKTGSGQ